MKTLLLALIATNLFAASTFTTKETREIHSKGLKRTTESKAFVESKKSAKKALGLVTAPVAVPSK